MNTQKRIILLENLLARMEYNSTQHAWKLSGAITLDEYECLNDARIFLIEKDMANKIKGESQ